MCCIFCEEPVRSITLGLAAVGLVCVINAARKLVKPQPSAASSSPARVQTNTDAPLETESAS
jgi:hypothetical protein